MALTSLADCTHERKVLVEGGYEREWEWAVEDDGRVYLVEDYPASFSDEGDGSYVLRCKTCLVEFPTDDIDFTELEFT